MREGRRASPLTSLPLAEVSRRRSCGCLTRRLRLFNAPFYQRATAKRPPTMMRLNLCKNALTVDHCQEATGRGTPRFVGHTPLPLTQQ